MHFLTHTLPKTHDLQLTIPPPTPVLILTTFPITSFFFMTGMMTIDVGDDNNGDDIGEDAATSHCEH